MVRYSHCVTKLFKYSWKIGDKVRFLAAAHTDIGISKKVNQDAFCLKIAKTPQGGVAFAVLCDGMGGLKNGEIASAFVVNAFSSWFENEFPMLLEKAVEFKVIQEKWHQMVNELNQKISSYGQTNNFALGTTLTAILIAENRYIYIQVGDSRLYRINDRIRQMTKDQTLAAQEIEHQRLTVEEAKNDSRQSVLLQCIGASKVVNPDFETGTIKENDAYMLCSDGFRHVVSDEELFGILATRLLTSEKIMKKGLVDLVNLNKSRQEKDNITAMIIKAIK